jgi:hypothetical protein
MCTSWPSGSRTSARVSHVRDQGSQACGSDAAVVLAVDGVAAVIPPPEVAEGDVVGAVVGVVAPNRDARDLVSAGAAAFLVRGGVRVGKTVDDLEAPLSGGRPSQR